MDEGMGGGREKGESLHVVVMPFPVQGHMAPMLQLSNLLAARGVRVTFVHLQSNLSRLHFAQPQPTNIHHVSLPDSLPGKATSSAASTRSRVLASEQLQPSFSHLLADLHATTKVSCIIADALMSWALTVGAQLGILGASLWTAALSSCAAYCNIPLLASNGVFPIKDMDGGALQLIRFIPGLPHIFSFADLPSFFHAPNWPDDVLDFISRQMKLMGNARWVLSNSVSVEPETELEEEMRKSLPIISVGPLLALQHHHFVDTQIPFQHLGAQPRASLWLEDRTCLQWLHGRPSSSVLYISFGSVVALSPLQVQEIALGLEASQVPFLWALRPDSIEHDDGEANGQPLSPSLELDVLLGRTELGLVVPWAPQLDVLAHDAIGGFMTHCGWNSVMESIAMGKPMLGFPRFAEQRMNCKLVEQWQVGKELQVGIHGLVDRHEMESCVKLLINEDEKNSFRSACAKLRVRVLNAFTNNNGPSLKNLDRFINELLEISE